jgi:hypothetical protein
VNGFSAGAFTYLLTQYLWQQTSTPENAIAYAVENIPKDFNQTPTYEVKEGSRYETQPIYFIDNPNSAADAVVTEVNGNQVKLWLGGSDLGRIGNGTAFTIVGARGGSAGRVTLQSREGLVGVATVEGVAQEGMLLKAQALSTGI